MSGPRPRPRPHRPVTDERVPDASWFANTEPIRATLAERVDWLETAVATLTARIAELGQALGVRGVPGDHDKPTDPEEP